MLQHIALTIENNRHLTQMMELFDAHKSNIIAAAFDTEGTGLNIIRDKSFLFQFGWATQDTIYTFAVDIELHPELATRTITIWNILASTTPIYLGHNVKFDLHMLLNMDLPYIGDNISDTMIWIRLASDNIPERKGGAPLALKKFATKYIHPKAKEHEHLLKAERTAIAQSYNKELQTALNQAGAPPAQWGYKSWTKGCLEKFFDDQVHDYTDLPPQHVEVWHTWHQTLPEYLQFKVTGYVDADMIRYDTLNRANVTKYGHLDIVWTLETYLRCEPIVKTRGQEEALAREHANIYPLIDMERQGFKVNAQYVLDCKAKTKQYIVNRRQDLNILAGEPLSIGQAKRIMEILYTRFGITVTTTNAEEFKQLSSDLKREGNHEQAIEFIEIIQELRSLEKWYSTYICKFVYDLQFGDTIYTTINQVGTVSGRVTSDFQQFPKDAIKTITGEELFSPRKMVLCTTGDYIGTVYLDYSQIELRLQAMYTILVGHADTNLCRAYMPYKCHTWLGDESHQQRKTYDYNELWCIRHAYDHVWYYDEEPNKKWEPLDVHGATTKIAFDIDEDDPRFHDLRYNGKRVNFAKNYGAQYAKIKTMFPEYSEEQVHKIDDAYYLAFPGVKEYHNYCYKIANLQPCVPNVFGVKYYGVSGHNLINMLVQGTGAYYLKWKIVEVSKYLKEHKCKSKLIMQIHDELQFLWHKDDDPQIFFDIQNIMQQWDDTLVPIVADMELSKTNWKEKFEVHTKEDFYAA